MQGKKVRLEQKFLRTNVTLVGFEIVMLPSQDIRPAQRTPSWVDVHDQYNLVEVTSVGFIENIGISIFQVMEPRRKFEQEYNKKNMTIMLKVMQNIL